MPEGKVFLRLAGGLLVGDEESRSLPSAFRLKNRRTFSISRAEEACRSAMGPSRLQQTEVFD